jgi:hypothetical protein
MTQSMLEFLDTGQVAGGLAQVVGKDFGELARQLELMDKNRAVEFVNPFGESFVEIQEAREAVESMDRALSGLVGSGAGDAAAQMFAQIAAHAGDLSESELQARFPQYAEALAQLDVQAQLAADSTGATKDAIVGASEAAGQAFTGMQAFAEGLGLSEEAAAALTERTQVWADVLAEFVTPLGAYQQLLQDKQDAERETAEATAAATKSQTDSWEDYAGSVAVSIGEYLGELEKQVQAQVKWSSNMLQLSSRVSEGTLDELAKMGPEGAPLVAELVDASDAELARLEAVFAARSSAAAGAFAEQLTLAQPVLTAVAQRAGQATADALAAELAAGRTTVAQIAAQYGVSVSGGIIPPAQAARAELARVARGLEGLDGSNVDITIRTLYRSIGTPGALTPRVIGVGGGIQEKHADGGYISGPGGPRDDLIPALLSNGEYVLRADAVKRLGVPMLDALNRSAVDQAGSALAGFAYGGFVSAADVRWPLLIASGCASDPLARHRKTKP